MINCLLVAKNKKSKGSKGMRRVWIFIRSAHEQG
jgi:hypothetical protein